MHPASPDIGLEVIRSIAVEDGTSPLVVARSHRSIFIVDIGAIRITARATDGMTLTSDIDHADQRLAAVGRRRGSIALVASSSSVHATSSSRAHRSFTRACGMRPPRARIRGPSITFFNRHAPVERQGAAIAHVTTSLSRQRCMRRRHRARIVRASTTRACASIPCACTRARHGPSIGSFAVAG